MELMLQDIKGNIICNIEIIFNKKISFGTNHQSSLPTNFFSAFPKNETNLVHQENFNSSVYNTNLNNNNLEINNKTDTIDFMKELKVFKSILTKIKGKSKFQYNEISSINLINILHDNNIIFPLEKISQILIFLDLNPQSFSFRDLIEKIEEAKVSHEEINIKDINVGIERIRDALFLSEKTPKDLFEMITNSKFISKEQFIKLMKNLQPNFSEILLSSIFSFFSKNTKLTRIDDFIPHFL
jgi:hypothetical protein